MGGIWVVGMAKIRGDDADADMIVLIVLWVHGKRRSVQAGKCKLTKFPHHNK